jgi:hypothetical protein
VSRLTLIAVAMYAGLFGLAFVIAPRSCDGGLEVYFWAGAATIVTLLAMPWILASTKSIARRASLALVWGLGGSLVWIVGFFAASVHFICRLF